MLTSINNLVFCIEKLPVSASMVHEKNNQLMKLNALKYCKNKVKMNDRFKRIEKSAINFIITESKKLGV